MLHQGGEDAWVLEEAESEETGESDCGAFEEEIISMEHQDETFLDWNDIF